MSDDQFVDIKVMEHEFRVACPAAEVPLLKQAVALLNHRMEEIRRSSKITGADRIAMMAAISISHEYLKIGHTEPFDIAAVQRRIEDMNNLINTALPKATDRLL